MASNTAAKSKQLASNTAAKSKQLTSNTAAKLKQLASNTAAKSKQLTRQTQVMLKKARLTSDADIKKDFKTFSQWYTSGKTLDTVKQDNNIDTIINTITILDRFENQNYRQYISYDKFVNIVKGKKPSEQQLQMERYDAVKLKSEKLNAYDDIKTHFNKFQAWYIDGKTIDEGKKALGINSLNQRSFKTFDQLFDKNYREFVAFEKFYNIMKNKKPSTLQLQMERYDAIKLKRAELNSYKDIEQSFDTLQKWYINGKTIDDVRKSEGIDVLEKKLPLAKRFENENYRKFVAFEKFDNIMKNKESSTLQLQMERYDAIQLKKAELSSYQDIEQSFDTLQRWYIKGNTVDEVKINLGLESIVRHHPTVRVRSDNELLLSYKKFYEIMKKEIPKTAP